MTSKEINDMIIDLENQIECFGGMSQFNYQLSILKSYKQDLERLEMLEIENQEWKKENEYLKSEGSPCEYKVLKNNYKFLKEDFDDLKKENLEEINLRIRTQMQCSKLEKEKHSLENEIEILKCRIDQLSYRNVSQENEKLKKKLNIYEKYTGIYYDKETKEYYISVDCEFGCKGDVITKNEFEVLG